MFGGTVGFCAGSCVNTSSHATTISSSGANRRNRGLPVLTASRTATDAPVSKQKGRARQTVEQRGVDIVTRQRETATPKTEFPR